MTQLAYLDDTYKAALTCEITATGTDSNGSYAVVNQTIAYPQGGGQPSDQGSLFCEGVEYIVRHAAYVDGRVRHYLANSVDLPAIGKRVEIVINSELRLRNSRAHTAGHLLSHVIENMFPGLQPIKGYHFPDGPHVEFLNTTGLALADQANSIENHLIREISGGSQVQARYATFDEISTIRPQLAALIPANKPTRIVRIGNYIPLPCGGTHVTKLAEIEQVRITKIKNKKDNIKVSYEVGRVPDFSGVYF